MNLPGVFRVLHNNPLNPAGHGRPADAKCNKRERWLIFHLTRETSNGKSPRPQDAHFLPG